MYHASGESAGRGAGGRGGGNRYPPGWSPVGRERYPPGSPVTGWPPGKMLGGYGPGTRPTGTVPVAGGLTGGLIGAVPVAGGLTGAVPVAGGAALADPFGVSRAVLVTVGGCAQGDRAASSSRCAGGAQPFIAVAGCPCTEVPGPAGGAEPGTMSSGCQIRSSTAYPFRRAPLSLQVTHPDADLLQRRT